MVTCLANKSRSIAETRLFSPADLASSLPLQGVPANEEDARREEGVRRAGSDWGVAMNLKLKSTLFVSAAAMIAATMSTPAFAQRSRDRQNGQQTQSQSRGGRQAQPRQSAPAQRQVQPQRVQPQRSAPPPVQQRRVEPQRVAPQQQQRIAPQQQQRFAPQRVDPRRVEPRNDVRGNDFRGFNGSRSVVAPRGYAVPRNDWRPGFFEPRHVIRVYRPYYSFRPHFNLGLGFFLGYSVPYPSFYDPYAYDPYYPGGYAITPGVSYGGMSFDVQPYDAQIFVDGAYVGTSQDFGPEDAPLTLTAGRHHVEVRAPGYQVMSFDANVVPGQVLPYQGTLGVIR